MAKNNEGTTNAGYLVFVTGGGTVNVESKTELINNHTTAVYVNTNSFLNMNGGAIKGNTTPEIGAEPEFIPAVRQ